jgi:hypothetical protein
MDHIEDESRSGGVTVTWLTDELKRDIKNRYEPLYKHKLTNAEVEEIAINLTDVIEAYLKMRWRQKYGDQITTTK